MNYAFLCPLKQNRLAPYVPQDMLGVAHSFYEHDLEQKLTLFSPRGLTKREHKQLNENIYDLLHDVMYRVTTRKYLSRVQFNPATLRILGRYYYILQVFGMGGLILCLWQGQYRADDIAQFAYWVLLMPLCVALGAGLIQWHIWETIRGLRKLYHSPLGIRIVALPQLNQLAEIVEKEGYEAALQAVRDLGLPELVLFYRRASQYPRWAAKEPNICGVIDAKT